MYNTLECTGELTEEEKTINTPPKLFADVTNNFAVLNKSKKQRN
jgi:hypothetical protein